MVGKLYKAHEAHSAFSQKGNDVARTRLSRDVEFQQNKVPKYLPGYKTFLIRSPRNQDDQLERSMRKSFVVVVDDVLMNLE